MLKKGLARGVVVPGIVLKKTATFCVCRLTKQGGKTCVRVTIDFGFLTSDWMRKWREIFITFVFFIASCIAFKSHVKNALMR